MSQVTNEPALSDTTEERVFSQGMSSTDISTVYDESEFRPREWAIAEINAIVEGVRLSLLSREVATIVLKTRGGMSSCFNDESLLVRRMYSSNKSEICFPTLNTREAWKFTVVTRILGIILETLTQNVIVTKRDIYYRDVELFVSQNTVDKYIDDIARTLNVERRCLNVTAAAKGLFYGDIGLVRANQSVVSGLCEPEGMLIPNTTSIASIALPSLVYILVVEKEATFRSLTSSGFPLNERCGRGLLITGKGYPDIATREFLRMIADTLQTASTSYLRTMPIYCVVDYDPHGIEILSVYKCGSAAMAHENHRLAVNGVRWLGIWPNDIPSYCWLTMSKHDRKKAKKLLQLPWIRITPKWTSELQRMLFLNAKAEIQAMANQTGGLERYLERIIISGTAA